MEILGFVDGTFMDKKSGSHGICEGKKQAILSASGQWKESTFVDPQPLQQGNADQIKE